MAINVPMPIGVPAPDIDFTQPLPAQPGSWTSEVAGYYYVDYNTGTDTARTYGDPTAPRLSIPTPIPAGSLVVVRNFYGYIIAGQHQVECQGDSGSWVANTSGPVFIDFGAGELDQCELWRNLFIHGDYFFVDGAMYLTEYQMKVGTPSSGYSVDHAVIRNCSLVGTNSLQGANAAIGVNAPHDVGGSTVRDVVIYNNTIADQGEQTTFFDYDANGLNASGDVKNVWMIYNTITNCSGAGIQLAAGKGTTTTCSEIYVGLNVIDGCSQAGIGCKYIHDTIISENVCLV